MKYVEFGPKHTRTFLESPKKPLGKVIAISDSDYDKIKHIHPSKWKAGNLKVTARKGLLKRLLLPLALILIGYLLGRL